MKNFGRPSTTTRCRFISSDLGIEDENARWSCLSWGAPRLLPHSAAECRKMRSGIQTRTTRTSIAAPKRGSITRSATYTFRLFFDRCLSTELDYQERHPESPYVYNEVDAAPWGAEQAWRLYDEEEKQWLDHWLITGGTRIVEFISDGMEMTDARMAVVGEKAAECRRKVTQKRSTRKGAPFSYRRNSNYCLSYRSMSLVRCS